MDSNTFTWHITTNQTVGAPAPVAQAGIFDGMPFDTPVELLKLTIWSEQTIILSGARRQLNIEVRFVSLDGSAMFTPLDQYQQGTFGVVVTNFQQPAVFVSRHTPDMPTVGDGINPVLTMNAQKSVPGSQGYQLFLTMSKPDGTAFAAGDPIFTDTYFTFRRLTS